MATLLLMIVVVVEVVDGWLVMVMVVVVVMDVCCSARIAPYFRCICGWEGTGCLFLAGDNSKQFTLTIGVSLHTHTVNH